MKPLVKEIFTGFFIGIFANAAGMYLYIYFFSDLSVESTLKAAWEEGFIGSLIALGAILNLGAFFIFLKKKKFYRARGVLMATVLAAIIILISKF